METAEYFQCWQTSLVQFKRVVGSSMDCLFSHHCLQGLIPQRWCQQAGLCPICYGKINMLLGWLKGHCLLWDESLLTSPSPVLCLPLGLPMQTSWKDLWWEPCILQQSVLLPIWLLAWPFFRKKENTDLFSGSSVQAPLGWPLGHKSREACEWRHSLLQQTEVEWFSSVHTSCSGGGSACSDAAEEVQYAPSLFLLLWGFMWDFLWFM